MQLNRRSLAWFIVAPSLLVSAVNLHADSVPALVNYQGRLTDAAGTSVPNGTYSVAFRLWTAKASTDPNDQLIWGREYRVAVVNGIFNVLLGQPDGTIITNAVVSDLGVAFNDSSRYLGLTITTGTNGLPLTNPGEIIPRQQVLTTPYAFRAANVPDASITSSKIASGAIGSSQLARNSVLSVNIADGAIGSAQIANASIGIPQLAPGIIAFIPRNIQVFTTSGKWTKPANVSSVYVKLWGAGGGGAGGAGGSGLTFTGGGGGGGAYCEGIVEVSSDVTVVVGSGGQAGLPQKNGSDGGSTSFLSLTAAGGGKGIADGGNGGAGGGASNGNINISGENGAAGFSPSHGGGGDSVFGGIGGQGGTLDGPGGNGHRFGGGGGGGSLGPVSDGTPAGASGGTGANGLALIYY